MSGILTSDEIVFLEKMENEKKLHANAQKNYRLKKSQNDPQYKTKINEYMKNYNAKKQNKYAVIKKKLLSEAPPKTVLIPSANEIINKGTKRGRKQAVEITPSYQTRKRDLKPRTIQGYISKANIIHRLFKGHNLSPELENVLLNLINNVDVDEKFIIDNMDYLKDITSTIETLRTEYYNDNSFKTYINALVVITSHLPSLKDNYQILTKLNINVNNAVQDKRDENKLEEYEKDKIIDLDRNLILKHLNSLTNIKDKLVFAVYT